MVRVIVFIDNDQMGTLPVASAAAAPYGLMEHTAEVLGLLEKVNRKRFKIIGDKMITLGVIEE